MSNKKISELNPITISELDNQDYIPVLDGTSNETKKLAIEILKLMSVRYCVYKYNNGNSWYEIYNDGWVRQGQNNYDPGTAGPSWKVVNLLVAMRDTNWSGTKTMNTSYAEAFGPIYLTMQKSTASFQAWTAGTLRYFDWVAEGFGSASALAALGIIVSY